MSRSIGFPCPRTDLSRGVRDRYADRRVAGQYSSAEMEFSDPAIDVAPHEAAAPEASRNASSSRPGSGGGIRSNSSRWPDRGISMRGAPRCARWRRRLTASEARHSFGRNDGMCASLGDSVVARACIAGTIRGDRPGLHVGGDPARQPGQHRRIAPAGPGEFDSPDFQRPFVDAQVDLALWPAFRAAMLSRMPLAFTLGIDAIRHCPRTNGGQCLIVDQ